MRLAALPALALLAAAAPGTAQSSLFELDGHHTADRFGQAVASAGDLDGDGLDDVLVGAPQDGLAVVQAGALFAYASGGGLLFEVHGDANGDHLGRSVASAGDVDGDGVPDVVAGAPYEDDGGPDAGKVRVLSGRDGSLLLAFDGLTPGGLLGWSVAGAGDVDGDGVPDLVAGAYADGSAGAAAGRVLALSGASGALLLDVAGPAAGDTFGFAVSRAGDVDGDGLADVLVGAPQGASVYGWASEGYASILSGAGGGELQHLDHPPAKRLGYSVAGGGDLDRDGLPDALVGSPGSNDTWVFSGSGGAVLYQFMQDGYSVAHAGDVNGDGFGDVVIGQDQPAGDEYCPKARVLVASGRDSSALFLYAAEHGGDAFGECVAGAGDLDGDGFADVLVGGTKKLDTFFGYCITGPGYANAYAGGYVAPVPALNALLVLEGDMPLSSFGSSVAGAGDLDGDGVPDLLVGARSDASVALSAGKASVHSGADGTVLLKIIGGGANDYLGWDVDGAGDVDGDGTPDLLIGAPEGWVLSSGPAYGPGYARLVSGRTGAVLQEPKGVENGDNFGASVAGVGDANADGTPDYLVGIPGRDLDYEKWGGARLYSGASGAVLLDVWEDDCCTSFGLQVAGGGDMNADGLADLLLSEPSADVGDTYNAGSVRALAGPGGATLHVWEGAEYADLFGYSLDGAGDVDQDGFGDAVAGAVQVPGIDPGLGYGYGPLYGPGYGRVLSGASGAALVEIHGTYTSVDFGREAAGLGDVDGDGVPDVAFGDTLDIVRVYSGADGTLVNALASPGPYGSHAFGQALASPGDVNADGLNELLVGGYAAFSPLAPGTSDGGAYLLPVLPVPFNAGCATSLGGAPVIAFAGGVPSVGGQGFAVRLLGAPQHAPAKLVAGLSNDAWHGLDLPLELAFAGFPGCKLLVAPEVLVPRTTDDLGEAQVAFDVPPVPGLAGLEPFFQWAVVEPGPGVLGFTAGLRALVAP